MSDEVLYAHSANSDGVWHTLFDHLLGTASLAEEFCRIEELKPLAYNLGLTHDLGKAYPQFQERLMGKKEKFDHPGLSVFLIKQRIPGIVLGTQLEELIRGHHRGLEIAVKLEDRILARAFPITEQIDRFLKLIVPYVKPLSKKKLSYHDSLYLFSCMCASDWCDTSEHFQTYEKKQNTMSVSLGDRIERHIHDLSK